MKTKSTRSPLTEVEALAFSKNMRIFQEKEDLTVKELAELLGVSSGYISNIKAGQYKASPRIVEELSKLSKIPESVLLTDPEDVVWAERKEFGKRCRKARSSLGYTKKQVCDFAGIGTSRILDEIESGQCSTTPEQREKLEKLLFPKMTVVAEATPTPEAEKPAETVKEDKSEVVAKTEAGIPYEVIDVVIKHVKDLNVSEDIQRKVFRSLSEYVTALKEEALFGK